MFSVLNKAIRLKNIEDSAPKSIKTNQTRLFYLRTATLANYSSSVTDFVRDIELRFFFIGFRNTSIRNYIELHCAILN